MGLADLAIRERDFEAAAQVETAPALMLTGNADARVVSPLLALVEALHAEVCATRAGHVVVDIRRLEFMNASCFNVFVTWLTLVNDLAPDQRYELRFTLNKAIPWQRRSFNTLSCFATDLVVLA